MCVVIVRGVSCLCRRIHQGPEESEERVGRNVYTCILSISRALANPKVFTDFCIGMESSTGVITTDPGDRSDIVSIGGIVSGVRNRKIIGSGNTISHVKYCGIYGNKNVITEAEGCVIMGNGNRLDGWGNHLEGTENLVTGITNRSFGPVDRTKNTRSSNTSSSISSTSITDVVYYNQDRSGIDIEDVMAVGDIIISSKLSGVGETLLEMEGNAKKASEGELTCVVCMENQRDVLFEPCNHICCCIECSRQLVDGEDHTTTCPMCRAEILRGKRVFT